jgi:hypothetical protein
LPAVTVGDAARAVKVPDEVERSSVVNVEIPAVLGAVAPGPAEPMDPYTMVHVAPPASVTPVTVRVGTAVPTVPQVEVV